jgi:hypothetical protein
MLLPRCLARPTYAVIAGRAMSHSGASGTSKVEKEIVELIRAAGLRLRFDRVVRWLVAELKADLAGYVPRGEAILFTVTAPVKVPKQTAVAIATWRVSPCPPASGSVGSMATGSICVTSQTLHQGCPASSASSTIRKSVPKKFWGWRGRRCYALSGPRRADPVSGPVRDRHLSVDAIKTD